MGYIWDTIFGNDTTPKPEPVLVKSPDAFDHTEYKELCGQAGFHPYNALSRHGSENSKLKFELFLAENGIGVYDDHKVTEYMRRICPPGMTWDWLEVDRYTELIPKPVILTMIKIHKEFISAQFMISRIVQDPKADPFLRVSYLGNHYIIERWDEPGYRS